MRRLWGRINSVNVQKVVWALEALALPYERIEAGGPHGVVDGPDYRAMNPNGLVPTYEEDGFVLWESNAVLRHLARTQGGALALPDDAKTLARIDQWLDWQATAFTPAMRDVFWHLVRLPEAERDPAAIEASRKASERMAAILDAHLSGTPYAAGAAFSIADIAVGCAAQRWFLLPIERQARPAIAAWLERLMQQPGASTVLSLPLT